MLFDSINIFLVVTALLNLLLGAIIYFNGSRKKINVVYSLNILAIIGWVLAMILYRSASPETSFFWCTVLYIAPTFIASSFLYFTYIFPSEKDKHVRLKAILIFSINLMIVAMVAWPGLIIKEVNARLGAEKEIVFTSYYWFYFLYTAGFFSYGFTRLFKKYWHSVGIERLQILYLVSGYALAANLAFATNLIMPWLGFFFLNWLGQIFTVIMVGLTAYAILRYRLMDIRIVARKIFMYVGSSVFVYAFFYFIIWFYNSTFGSVFSPVALAIGVVIAPFFVVAFYVLDKGLKIFANKYLFASLYNYQETINKLADELNYYIDLDKIVGLIVDSIKETMQLNRTGVLLINDDGGVLDYQIAKVIGFNEKNGISLVQDSFLTKHLQRENKPLVLEELALLARDAKTREEKKGFTDLYEHMNRIEASLCLPLMSSSKLMGIIVLGAKISGDAYTKEDLELLNTLSKQAGIAIENARLYKQVQEFGKKLTAEVDKATRDLKEANVHLEALIKIKDEFLQIASHQLRTPVSVMRGMLDMLREDGSSLTQEQRDEMIERASLKSEKLSQVIDDVLSATEMDVPNFNILGTAREVDLKELAQKVVDSQKDEAADKGLTLILEADKNVLQVKASDTYLPQAMTNLIDNAIKYTKEGKVVVKVYPESDMVVFAVKDTGIGVPEQDLEKLWTKFKRGGNAKNVHTDGSGLGLFIIKKIVEGHPGGQVFVDSQLGSGSTFGFKLPMIKKGQ